MVILGIILLLLGAGLVWAYRQQTRRSFSLKLARRTTVADLNMTAAAVAAEIGGGDWRDYVKLWGSVEVDKPLISELKQEPCVYYTTAVEREYEETVVEKNSNNRTQTTTRRSSETLSSHRQSVPFYLVDETGRILVDPEGANLETVEVLNQFQPGEPAAGVLTFGQFSLTLGESTGSRRRTLGYRYRESVLPVSRSVLVVGMVSDLNGFLTIGKPNQPRDHYIIALKSDELLAASADRSAKILLAIMLGLWGAGLILVIIGLLK